jgi:uncharacterized protein DUF2459
MLPVVSMMMAGCVAAPPRAAAPAAASEGAAGTTVYVARRRWHIDVGFAAGELQEPLAASASRFPQARYVFFGFGDRRYLMADERGVPTTLAALWPGAGLILVTTLTNTPQQAFGAANVIELRVTSTQASALQRFIRESMSGGPDASFAFEGPGPYQGSAYFKAVPRYSALHTCITWAAEALRAGGLPVRTRLTLVAAQLWGQVLKLDPRNADSVAGGRIAVLADHGGRAALRDDNGGFGGWRRAATADAAGQ